MYSAIMRLSHLHKTNMDEVEALRDYFKAYPLEKPTLHEIETMTKTKWAALLKRAKR